MLGVYSVFVGLVYFLLLMCSVLQGNSFRTSKEVSYSTEVIVSSPVIEHKVPFPVVPQLKISPRALPLRVSAMIKVLVSIFKSVSNKSRSCLG